jgi:hypothetical protein
MFMWKGVIVEESLEDKSVLDEVKLVLRTSAYLENEEGRGKFNFAKVEVNDLKLSKVLTLAKKFLKKGWYIHFCKDDKMIVVFKNISFEHKKGYNPSLDQIRRYGKSVGVNVEQLPTEKLIDNPWS